MTSTRPHTLVLVLTLLGGSHFACTDTPTQTLVSAEDLLPLAIGNQWTMETSVYDSLGALVGVEHLDTIRIAGDTIVSGDRWFYQRYLGHLVSYRNSDAGTLIRLVSPFTDGKSKLLFENPTATGRTYGHPEVTFSGNSAWLDDSTNTVTVGSTDAGTIVPAGTFKCFVFEVRERQSSIEYRREFFVSPGFGWIRTDHYFRLAPGGSAHRVRSTVTTTIVLY
jgi:hypothetical protein